MRTPVRNTEASLPSGLQAQWLTADRSKSLGVIDCCSLKMIQPQADYTSMEANDWSFASAGTAD